MAVKYIRLDFFRFYGFQFPELFNDQGLSNLVEHKGFIYPDLIRLFYFNMRYRDGIISTKVKGVRIILDDDVWTNVAQLPIWDDAVKVHLGLQDFDRLLTFQSFLRHPEQQTNRRQLLVGGFKMGFITRGRVLIHKDDDPPDVDEDDDMDTHMADPVRAAAPSDAGPSNIPSSSSISMEEHFARLSKQLEDMSLAQKTHFEAIYDWQRSVDEHMVDQFLDLDVRLSNIETHLNIQPPARSPILSFRYSSPLHCLCCVLFGYVSLAMIIHLDGSRRCRGDSFGARAGGY
ncbi:hypothetical protein LR48_Vigan01g095700 [Vigna angularis]|uniref:Uncharacterized protein n=1 Tax=Phaseolus angularis TaxID=3914 RepID=A0A0L9TLS0_PHAAN|nr:hypothetical protein LR48_Vigan01g095700 [Vigna angularis]